MARTEELERAAHRLLRRPFITTLQAAIDGGVARTSSEWRVTPMRQPDEPSLAHACQWRLQLHRGRRRGHVLASGALGQVEPVSHPPHDIALGDDPYQAIAVQDDQRADDSVF
jgi:hypothetical protein